MRKTYLAWYLEQDFPPETMAWLWQQMYKDSLPEYVFDHGRMPTLQEFINAMNHPTCAVCLPYVSEDGRFTSLEQIIGAFWFAGLIQGHKATLQGWIREAYRGQPENVGTVHRILKQIFSQPFSLRTVFAISSVKNGRALRFLEKLHFAVIGMLPDWFRAGDEFVAGVLHCLSGPQYIADLGRPEVKEQES
jgi:RimJ/RimL family protein N-acetyltransferase